MPRPAAATQLSRVGASKSAGIVAGTVRRRIRDRRPLTAPSNVIFCQILREQPRQVSISLTHCSTKSSLNRGATVLLH